MNKHSQTMVNVVLLALVLTFALPASAWACTGFAPTMVLLGPILNTGSLWGGTAVAHSVWGMLIVVAMKCGLFYWKSDLKPVPAVSFMFLGNVYSTIPAMLLILPLGSGAIADSLTGNIIFIIGVSFLIFAMPARSLVRREPFKKLNFVIMALILSALLLVAIFSLYAALDMEQTVIQMLLKLICGTASITIAFIVSIACEEGVISWLYKKKFKQDVSFMDPVFKVNTAAFVLMLILFTGTQTLQIASVVGNYQVVADARVSAVNK